MNKDHPAVEKWKWYAVSEGLSKTASNAVVKLVGTTGGSFGTSILATLVIGFVQMFGGLTISLFQKVKLFPDRKLVFGSVLFGTTAVIMTVTGLYVFTFDGADIGIFVFITLFGLLPGAFIDWIFFKTPLTLFQWLGLGVFIFGGYSMLNFPSLHELLVLPLWVLIAFVNPLGAALNEGFTRWISMSAISNPFVNNFWVGLTTIIISVVVLAFTPITDVFSSVSTQFYLLSAAIGVIVLVMISFKLLSYKAGGTIAHKKIVMQGVHLMTAILVGFLFFAEPITFGKIVGVGCFFLAMFLMERKSVT